MIVYLFKTILLMAIFLGIYYLMLEQEKMHRFNRFYLLAALVFSLTIPLFTIESSLGVESDEIVLTTNTATNYVETTIGNLRNDTNPGETVAVKGPESRSWFDTLSLSHLIFGLYIVISLLLLVRMVMGITYLLLKKNSSETIQRAKAQLVLVEEHSAPHSFFGYIFLNRDDYQSGKIPDQIIIHELVHHREKHSLDILFVELLKVLLWINPFIYMYKRAIRINHEYIADDRVLESSVEIATYASQLMNVASYSQTGSLVSNFNFTVTKKRFQMMCKKSSKSSIRWKKVVLLPVVLVLAFTFCKRTDSSTLPAYNLELTTDTIRVNKSAPILEWSKDGQPFTGKRQMNEHLGSSISREQIFQNGLLLETNHYSEVGTIGYSETHEYRDSFLSTTRIFIDGRLFREVNWPLPANNFKGITKVWHDNEQLQYEENFIYREGEKLFHGFLTEYDKQGNMVEQKRYENGVLVEKLE